MMLLHHDMMPEQTKKQTCHIKGGHYNSDSPLVLRYRLHTKARKASIDVLQLV